MRSDIAMSFVSFLSVPVWGPESRVRVRVLAREAFARKLIECLIGEKTEKISTIPL